MPLPTYATDADVLQAIVDALTSTGDTSQVTAAKWPRVAAQANQWAITDITNILINKGYTQAQLDAADDRVSWNLKLALWYGLTTSNPLGGYPDSILKGLDIREFLGQTGTIRIGGIPTGPTVGGTDVGGISYGTSTTQRDAILEEWRCRGIFR